MRKFILVFVSLLMWRAFLVHRPLMAQHPVVYNDSLINALDNEISLRDLVAVQATIVSYSKGTSTDYSKKHSLPKNPKASRLRKKIKNDKTNHDPRLILST